MRTPSLFSSTLNSLRFGALVCFVCNSLFAAEPVIDTAGLTVPDAKTAVTVQVEGAGRLIGLDSGDLDYGGLFKVANRDIFQGRLLATIQRTAASGDIRSSVAAPGLPSVVLASPANQTSPLR